MKGLIINEDLSLAADQQEEVDRSEVGLYGMKSKVAPQVDLLTQPPVMQLHKQCMNCSVGTAGSQIHELFKIACLAYTPKPVRMAHVGHEVVATRQEILKRRAIVVEGAKLLSGRVDEQAALMSA